MDNNTPNIDVKDTPNEVVAVEAEQKKSEKREKEEKLETKLKEKRLIEKKSSKEIITADSLEALKKKIDEYNYMQRADNVKSEEEKTIGSFFDIKGWWYEK